jgi:hypothetical protein
MIVDKILFPTRTIAMTSMINKQINANQILVVWEKAAESDF